MKYKLSLNPDSIHGLLRLCRLERHNTTGSVDDQVLWKDLGAEFYSELHLTEPWSFFFFACKMEVKLPRSLLS